MTRLAGIEHHPHARAVLGGALPPDGEPSHAYLFEGPAGSGKDEVAREFAAALLADGAADAGSALARARSGAHPDLTWVAPISSAGLLRGDIDEPVVDAATRTPFESRRRVFVIDAADSLNDQAANRMLKTLEEPPPYAHLILLTDRPGKVLPTIASRCQRVRFDAPDPDAIAERLAGRGVAPEQAAACARLGLGRRRPRRRARAGRRPRAAGGRRGVRARRACAASWPTGRGSSSSSARATSPSTRATRSRSAWPRTASSSPRRTASASSGRAPSGPSARSAAPARPRSTTGSSWSASGCATSPASPSGAPELVHHTDRRDGARRGRRGPAARAAALRPGARRGDAPPAGPQRQRGARARAARLPARAGARLDGASARVRRAGGQRRTARPSIVAASYSRRRACRCHRGTSSRKRSSVADDEGRTARRSRRSRRSRPPPPADALAADDRRRPARRNRVAESRAAVTPGRRCSPDDARGTIVAPLSAETSQHRAMPRAQAMPSMHAATVRARADADTALSRMPSSASRMKRDHQATMSVASNAPSGHGSCSATPSRTSAPRVALAAGSDELPARGSMAATRSVAHPRGRARRSSPPGPQPTSSTDIPAVTPATAAKTGPSPPSL